jgi:hypothetical protein
MANRVQQFIRSVLFNSSLNAIRMKDVKTKSNLLKIKNKMRNNQMIIQKRGFHSIPPNPMFGFGGGGGGGQPNDIFKIILTIFAIYASRKLID